MLLVVVRVIVVEVVVVICSTVDDLVSSPVVVLVVVFVAVPTVERLDYVFVAPTIVVVVLRRYDSARTLRMSWRRGSKLVSFWEEL